MSDIRVKGFEDVSFWREDDIGLIVVRSSAKGEIRKRTIDELIMVLSTASIDPEVKAVAITGQNDVFVTEIFGWENPTELLNSIKGLASMIYSMEVPVFSIINGDAIDFGYELALLSDVIIASPQASLGFSKSYAFSMAGSLSSLKFNIIEVAKAKENQNCDYVFPPENLLGNAKSKIQELNSQKFVLRRRNRLKSLGETLSVEHLALLSKLSELGGKSQ